MQKVFYFCLILFFFIIPARAYAHQPKIVATDPVIVTDPEISKAYYDMLIGVPRNYLINSDVPFNLFLQVSVPENSNPSGRYILTLYNEKQPAKSLVSIGEEQAPWVSFYEPFGGDTYLQGPEVKMFVPAGRYKIQVSGNNNLGKYVLAVGSKESFTVGETLRAISVIPTLKKQFFNLNPAQFILSIFGVVYLIITLVIGIITGYIWHKFNLLFVRKSRVKNYIRNIGTNDRLIRLIIASALLIIAVTTTWNWFLLVVSGFCFYETFSSWCGFYAILGKNTCKISKR